MHGMRQLGVHRDADAVALRAVVPAVEHEIAVRGVFAAAIEPAEDVVELEGMGKAHICPLKKRTDDRQKGRTEP